MINQNFQAKTDKKRICLKKNLVKKENKETFFLEQFSFDMKQEKKNLEKFFYLSGIEKFLIMEKNEIFSDQFSK